VIRISVTILILFFVQSDSNSLGSDRILFSLKPSKSFEFQNKVVSSSHLIQLHRPESLPPKPLEEQLKHQKEYERMVEAVKKKGKLMESVDDKIAVNED